MGSAASTQRQRSVNAATSQHQRTDAAASSHRSDQLYGSSAHEMRICGHVLPQCHIVLHVEGWAANQITILQHPL
jgi:hypothetical protein